MANSADPDQLSSSDQNQLASSELIASILFAKVGYIRVQQDNGNCPAEPGYTVPLQTV